MISKKYSSSKPRRFLGLLSISLALFIIAGGPLMLLQGVAWTSMIQEYSKTDTLVSAVQKTFSGKYRCSLCKKIAEESKKEQKATALVKTDKALKAILLSPQSQDGDLFLKEIPYPQILALEYTNIFQEPPAPYPRASA